MTTIGCNPLDQDISGRAAAERAVANISHDADMGMEGSSDEDLPSTPAAALSEPRGPPAIAWAALDSIDLADEFRRRVPCLKGVPHFLRGSVRSAFRLALEAVRRASRHGGSPVSRLRAWKLFNLVPRLILHKTHGENFIPKEVLLNRADRFQRGEWHRLLKRRTVNACQVGARAAVALTM